MMQIKQMNWNCVLTVKLALSLSLSQTHTHTHTHTQMHIHTNKQNILMAAACLSGNWKSMQWWSGWLLDPSACWPVGAGRLYGTESTGEVHKKESGILESQTRFRDSTFLIWGYIMTILHLTDLKMAAHFPILSFLSFTAISHQKYKYQYFQIISKNTHLQPPSE